MRKSGHTRQADDWYVEPAWCVDALLKWEKPFVGGVMDPCCGRGNIVDRLVAHDVIAYGSDMRDRADGRFPIMDYAKALKECAPDSVVSNPPFRDAQAFIEAALAVTTDRVCVLLRLAFLEGIARGKWFPNTPLARVWVSSQRISMPPGDSDIPAENGKVAHAWFVFEHGHNSRPEIGWFSEKVQGKYLIS